MFDLLLAPEVVPATRPGLPYEQIGLILVAIVTSVTGIIVAIIQKGRAPATPTPTQPSTSGFQVSEVEWIAVRNGYITLSTKVEGLRNEFDQHDRISQDHMHRMNGKIHLIEGRIGGPLL